VVCLLLFALLATGLLAPPAVAAPTPTPEPNFGVTLLPRPCAYEGGDPYEARFYEREGWPGPEHERYPGACQRLRFAYGPLAVKPGQNDVLIGPITTEKPAQDGYITRFKPNLVRSDGSVPPVEQVHLHHGTWLSTPSYGSGPFFAAGEEKTIAPYPKGYGMPVRATDQWQLLYMVHSAVSQPMEVYITYDVDFVPADKGRALGIRPAYPVWLDVRPSGYPVFNVQRDFGGRDGECTWPKEKCAGFDPYGKKFIGQGDNGNGRGTDYRLPSNGQRLGQIEKFTGGTLIGIGGHVHPGGLRNEIDLVRPGRAAQVRRRAAARRRCKRAGTRRKSGKRRRGKASAKKRKKARRKCRPARRKARRKSTNRRAKTSAKKRKKKKARSRCKPARRKARRKSTKRRAKSSAKKRKKKARRKCKRPRRRSSVQQSGDSVRIYSGEPAYWDHKNPSREGGPPTSWDFSMKVTGLPNWGVRVEPGDILRSNATYETKIQSSYENMGIAVALLAPDDNGKPTAPGVDPFTAPKDPSEGCKSGGLGARDPTLCDRGIVTHGHMPENGNHAEPGGTWNARSGFQTGDVTIADFLYAPGDLSTISMTGVPTVKLGSKLRFSNSDSHSIYHTVTSCGFPCLGRTAPNFPLADGKTSTGRQLDFDSSELGFGPQEIGPAKNQATWDLPITSEEGYQPGEVVTYFCRIHPSMRGAFEVTR
jgi:hypothetical protein